MTSIADVDINGMEVRENVPKIKRHWVREVPIIIYFKSKIPFRSVNPGIKSNKRYTNSTALIMMKSIRNKVCYKLSSSH